MSDTTARDAAIKAYQQAHAAAFGATAVEAGYTLAAELAYDRAHAVLMEHISEGQWDRIVEHSTVNRMDADDFARLTVAEVLAIMGDAEQED